MKLSVQSFLGEYEEKDLMIKNKKVLKQERCKQDGYEEV